MTALQHPAEIGVVTTCPDCDGAGELYGDWRRDPDSGRYYPELVGMCGRCQGSGETDDVSRCDACPTGAGVMVDHDDNQCSHGYVLCEVHHDVCPECVEESEDVDLDAWDPWADAL